MMSAAVDRLPFCVSATEHDEVEASLVPEAIKSDAEIVTTAAKMIDAIFPDGDHDEKDGERRRGITLGPQGRDGMSRLHGLGRPGDALLCAGRLRRGAAGPPPS